MAKIVHWLLNQKYSAEKSLFSLFLLFLPTQLGKHFWPSYSYLLGIRSDYLSPTLYITDIIVVLLFVVWLWSACGKRGTSTTISKHFINLRRELHGFWKIYKHKKKIREKKNVYFIILYFVYLIVTIFFANDFPLGLYGMWKLTECLFIVLYVAKRSSKIISFSHMVFLLCIGATCESFLEIGQFINQGSLGGIFYWFGERTFTDQTVGIADMSLNGASVLRPYATFSHPNVLAGYLLLVSTMALFYSIRRRVFLIFYGFLSIGLLVTYSRTAILYWAFVLLMFVVWRLQRDVKKLLVGIPMLLLCAVSLAYLGVYSRFLSLRLTDESVTQRQLLLSASWQLFVKHPFFGVGVNNFLPSLSVLPIMQFNYFLLQPVHTIFMLVLVELGAVGFSFFLVWIGYMFYFLFSQWRSQKKKQLFSLLCMLLLSEICFTGLFDHYWLTLQQGQFLFAAVAGLSFNKKFLIE